MGKETREQSAIDVIYLVEKMIKTLDQKIDIIDNNVKLLSNKIVKLQKTVNNMGVAPAAVSGAAPVKVVDEQPITKTGERSDKYITGPIRVFGKIVSKSKTPISDVQVAIFNNDGDVVKTRKTDSKGYWEVRLPAGKYGVEYTRKNFKPINVVIELKDDDTEFEVK